MGTSQPACELLLLLFPGRYGDELRSHLLVLSDPDGSNSRVTVFLLMLGVWSFHLFLPGQLRDHGSHRCRVHAENVV